MYRLASDYEICDILCSTDTSKRMTVRFGLRDKCCSKFVLPEDNFIQYKLLYKTNADCNNFWNEVLR